MYIKKTNKEKLERFIKKSKINFDCFYDYSESKYTSAKTKLKIICPIHGPFFQTPNNHLSGYGCIHCGIDKRSKDQTKSAEQFFKEFDELKLNHIDVDMNTYVSAKIKMKLFCKIHKEYFNQTPDSLLNAKSIGCKRCCTGNISKGEKEIVDFIKSFNVEVIENDKTLIYPLELDIVVPKNNLAIEYCGIYWHSERSGKDKNYHYMKYENCKKLNIQLLTIFDDEWINKKEQIKNKITHILQRTHDKIYARNTTIYEINKKDKKQFLDDNHIQGDGPSSINIGLHYNNSLVACMSFINHKDNNYTLSRYATSNHIVGGFSKLLKYFKSNYDWYSIISFADLRWSDGNLYEKTGWKMDKTLKPDYFYLYNHKRNHKFNFRRKHLKNILGEKFDSTKSEYENCLDNEIYRIWDCGKIRYKMINQKL